MSAVPWFVAVGAILIILALTSSFLSRLPLSTSVVCLVLGILLGPMGIGLVELELIRDAALIERLTEVAVIISLFAAGLQLRLPFDRREWGLSLTLATLGMVLTIGLIAGLGVLIGLPIGAAVILGAVLAPTDPVLASDVQVKHSTDDDPLRFVLTGEAGFNDGAAFPFVMLGLGLLGLHELGDWGWRWWMVDVIWAVLAGLSIGAALGTAVGHVVLYLRRQEEALGLNNFLGVGLIAISYGAALWMHAYGFLAVFAAGLALRHLERRAETQPPSESLRNAAGAETEEQLATAEETAPAYLAEAIVNFNSHLEHFAEVTLVILIGALLRPEMASWQLVATVAAVILVVRPVAVLLAIAGMPIRRIQRAYIAWFGIRGIGSIYYLTYAIEHGFHSPPVETVVNLAFATIATSILVHGITVTPLMNFYSRHTDEDQSSPEEASEKS
ncbi:cation:proton antiporter [Rubinisphaera margarita]|uniref:cation:proton antiporter n=1 Tax=Rubinisphaera margarita TaxID=2909586 RepID=UPI001EE8DD7A|nr:sodium:proton antiporter [Rubinisphaera margarita]MCG6155040.1 sodium:proton antiporter [Rubinisphaera margarita]